MDQNFMIGSNKTDTSRKRNSHSNELCLSDKMLKGEYKHNKKMNNNDNNTT